MILQLNLGTIALDYMCYNKAYNLPVLLIGENIPLICYANYEMFLHIFREFIEPQLITATCWSSQEI